MKETMQDIDLVSTAFDPGGFIPDRYTCLGNNISPPLEWSKIPDEAESLALIMDDPDASGGMFVHWVLYNLPPDMNGLPENYKPGADVGVGRKSSGRPGYSGPCPPVGDTHRYYFRLYALDSRLDLTSGATRAQVIDAMREHVLAETELIGQFGR